MLKKIVYIFIFICLGISLCACHKNKAIILFNNNPITRENLLDSATDFVAGKKIYYIFMTDKPLKTELIRMRLVKIEGKANKVPVKLVYSNDLKLRKDQIYYYNNYIVLHEPGEFVMEIYSLSRLKAPLAIANFRVKN